MNDQFLYEFDAELPLSSVTLILSRTGACIDSPRQRGLTQLTLKLWLCGAGPFEENEFQARLESLGASLGVYVASDYVSLRLLTLTENLEAGLALFGLALHAPRFDEAAFHVLRKRMIGRWFHAREQDKQLRIHEQHLSQLFDAHPRSYMASGTPDGLARCELEDVKAHYQHLLRRGRPHLAVLSSLKEAEVVPMLTHQLPGFMKEALAKESSERKERLEHPWDQPQPRLDAAGGLKVSIIDLPNSQSDELLLGGFSTRVSAPDWHVHELAELIFGGDTNSRLFHRLRGNSGLCYSTSAWHEATQGFGPLYHPTPFSVYAVPSAEHTAEALPLLISLYQEFVQRGVSSDELHRARRTLINAFPFRGDTAHKRLLLRLEHALYGVACHSQADYRALLAEVTPNTVKQALVACHRPEQATVTLLGDAKRLRPIAERIPELESLNFIQVPSPSSLAASSAALG